LAFFKRNPFRPTYFFSTAKRSTWIEGIQDKTIMDDGAKRAFGFLLS
jgi:hypothetical protein